MLEEAALVDLVQKWVLSLGMTLACFSTLFRLGHLHIHVTLSCCRQRCYPVSS